MARTLALAALVALAVVGCSKYRTRAQGPFNRAPAAANPGVNTPGSPSPPSQLALGGSPPAPNLIPPPPPEASPVPPRPPEPAPIASAVAPPQPPRPPAVVDPSVQPAAALDAGPPRRPQPNPGVNTPGSPSTPGSPAPAPAASGASNTQLAALKKLAQTAADKWKTIDGYEAKLVRRETVDGTPAQTEEVVFRFRKQPVSVYMKNVGPAGKGREVLYNPTQHRDVIHVIVGEGDPGGRLFKPGSKAPALSPDSPMVRSKSRHSIREAGFGTPVASFARLVDKVEAGKLPADALKYAGPVRRDEYGDLPLVGVEQAIRPREDESLPGGGVRHWFFDAKPESPSYGLPLLTVLYDANRKELEYYCFSQVRPVKLTDADFDPARLGAGKK